MSGAGGGEGAASGIRCGGVVPLKTRVRHGGRRGGEGWHLRGGGRGSTLARKLSSVNRGSTREPSRATNNDKSRHVKSSRTCVFRARVLSGGG